MRNIAIFRVFGGLLGGVVGFFAPVFVATLFMPTVSYEVVLPWICPSMMGFVALGVFLPGLLAKRPRATS